MCVSAARPSIRAFPTERKSAKGEARREKGYCCSDPRRREGKEESTQEQGANRVSSTVSSRQPRPCPLLSLEQASSRRT